MGFLSLIVAGRGAAGGGTGSTPTFNVTVGNQTNTNNGGSLSTNFWGWNTVTGIPAQYTYYPDGPMGACTTTNPGLNGIPFVGAYSASASSAAPGNDAAAYYLLLAGNYTSGITSMSVNGTSLGVAPSSYTYDASNGVTRVLFTKTNTTTLFGTTIGASIAVVIA